MPAGYMGFIDRVGLELEGGGFRKGRGTPGWHHDGSVNRELGEGDAGEVATPKPYRTWTYLKRWVTKEYPKSVDSSCGLHVHTSFRDPSDYARLMEPRFNEYFMGRWDRFIRREKKRCSPYSKARKDLERLEARFQGDNNYCTKSFQPLDQWYWNTRGSDRYTQLNFCYGLHKTLECRLLPMFCDLALGLRAIRYLLSTYELFLRVPAVNSPIIYVDDTELSISLDEPYLLRLEDELEKFPSGSIESFVQLAQLPARLGGGECV